MSIDTVKTAVEKAIAYACHKGAGHLHIIWHGGEPLLAGLDFFKDAQAAVFDQKPSIPVTQFLQTNGLLLDEKFCHFFSTQNIQVGISLDGPKEIHDAVRITRQGKGTHGAVIKTLKRCRQNGLAVGLCMVVTPACLGKEKQIFQFFNELGLPFRANPVLPEFAAPPGTLLSPGDYGDFLCRLFDEWIQSKPRSILISPLDHYLYSLNRGIILECRHLPSCVGNFLGVTPDGGLVLCSRFQDRVLGHIQDDILDEIYGSSLCTALAARSRKLSTCRRCPYKSICHGGCPHNAAVFSQDITGPDPLCRDYAKIFRHIDKALELEGERWINGRAWCTFLDCSSGTKNLFLGFL